MLKLKFLVDPKSALFWDWLWFLMNIPPDKYSKTHSLGLAWMYTWSNPDANTYIITFIQIECTSQTSMIFPTLCLSCYIFISLLLGNHMGPFRFDLRKSICSNELCLIVLYRYTDEWQQLMVIHWKIPSPNFLSDLIYNIAHTILQSFSTSIFGALPPSLFWGLFIIPNSLLWLQPW